jgi:hypothetical protein
MKFSFELSGFLKLNVKLWVAFFAVVVGLVLSTPAYGGLNVTVAPLKVGGHKCLIRLTLKNAFSEKVESARATVFLTDDQNKVVGQATRWVIGGTKDRPALEPDKEIVFNFVVTTKESASTNGLTPKITFNRVILEGGKLADPVKSVQITGP